MFNNTHSAFWIISALVLAVAFWLLRSYFNPDAREPGAQPQAGGFKCPTPDGPAGR